MRTKTSLTLDADLWHRVDIECTTHKLERSDVLDALLRAWLAWITEASQKDLNFFNRTKTTEDSVFSLTLYGESTADSVSPDVARGTPKNVSSYADQITSGEAGALLNRILDSYNVIAIEGIAVNLRAYAELLEQLQNADVTTTSESPAVPLRDDTDDKEQRAKELADANARVREDIDRGKKKLPRRDKADGPGRQSA